MKGEKEVKLSKKLVLLFVALLSLSMFVACNKEEEAVTIEFWHNYSAGAGQVAVLGTLIDEFEAEHTNVTVNEVFMEWSALKSNVVSGASTGTLPDVMRGDIAFVPQFQSLNVLEELSAYSDYSTVAATVLASANSTNMMGDKYYGLAANTNTKILFYNKTLLTAAGIDEPTTLAELWTAVSDITDENVIGMVEPWTGIWNVGPYIWSQGGSVLSPDNSTATGYLNSASNKAVIQTLVDLYNEGAVGAPSVDPGATGDTDGWASGLYAFQVDGPWRASSNDDAGVDYEAIPLPAGSGGSHSVLGGEDFMVFKTSEQANKDAAWEFVKFMASEHAQVEMAKVGQMPVNLAALDNAEAIAAMPLLPVFKEALLTAKSRPVTPLWSDMENIIATKVAEAILGDKTVSVALDEAAADIDALISGN